MGMNAFVYGKYIDSYLTNRVELLNTMADCIAQLGSTDPDDEKYHRGQSEPLQRPQYLYPAVENGCDPGRQ